jgi:hypothetical protein
MKLIKYLRLRPGKKRTVHDAFEPRGCKWEDMGILSIEKGGGIMKADEKTPFEVHEVLVCSKYTNGSVADRGEYITSGSYGFPPL